MTPSSGTPPYPRLLGDVGGTNARFGWQARAGAALEHIQVLPCAEHAHIADAIETYLARTGQGRPVAAAIGIANPVTGDQVSMTNHHWSFSIRELQTRLGLQRLVVINDFTALALALPDLRADQRVQVGAGEPVARAPIALLGPGTGLGVSGLLPVGDDHWLPIAGEGGHVTLAGRSAREDQAIALIRQQHGHASCERVLSGQGLSDLHRALSQLQGAPQSPQLTPAEITSRALAQQDALCLDTLEMFTDFLATAASDLALTLGARAGVYIGGGIVPRLLPWFLRSGFRRRFEDKGRFSGYLSSIPVWVIQAPDPPALWGAARALDGA